MVWVLFIISLKRKGWRCTCLKWLRNRKMDLGTFPLHAWAQMWSIEFVRCQRGVCQVMKMQTRKKKIRVFIQRREIETMILNGKWRSPQDYYGNICIIWSYQNVECQFKEAIHVGRYGLTILIINLIEKLHLLWGEEGAWICEVKEWVCQWDFFLEPR